MKSMKRVDKFRGGIYGISRNPGLVVASASASKYVRNFSDYACDGVADDVEINAALAALPAGGGKVVLSEGTFTLAAQLARAIDNVTIEGQGKSTRLNLNGVTPVIAAGAQAGWALLGFDTDAGGISIASATQSLARHWLNGVYTEAGEGLDRNKIRLSAEGLIAENFSRQAVGGNSIAIDGSVYYMAVGLLAGETVTKISIAIGTAGATMSLSKVGLYDSAFARLALSADQAAGWESSGLKTIALGTPYVVPTDGLYYAAIVSKGATIPQFARGSSVTIPSNAVGSGKQPYAVQTGQADLPASGTPAVTPCIAYWVGIS